MRIKADMDKILHEGDGVLLVMLDLSAAFDTLDHEILLKTLETCSTCLDEVILDGMSPEYIRYVTCSSQGKTRGTQLKQHL